MKGVAKIEAEAGFLRANLVSLKMLRRLVASRMHLSQPFQPRSMICGSHVCLPLLQPDILTTSNTIVCPHLCMCRDRGDRECNFARLWQRTKTGAFPPAFPTARNIASSSLPGALDAEETHMGLMWPARSRSVPFPSQVTVEGAKKLQLFKPQLAGQGPHTKDLQQTPRTVP